jgi:hypothetical protein
MAVIQPSLNHLLKALPAAELETLHPQLEQVELVRETVLVEAGDTLTHVYLPHGGVISLPVRLSEGQTVEVATVGRDGILGAAVALWHGRSCAGDSLDARHCGVAGGCPAEHLVSDPAGAA